MSTSINLCKVLVWSLYCSWDVELCSSSVVFWVVWLLVDRVQIDVYGVTRSTMHRLQLVSDAINFSKMGWVWQSQFCLQLCYNMKIVTIFLVYWIIYAVNVLNLHFGHVFISKSRSLCHIRPFIVIRYLVWSCDSTRSFS